MSEALQLKRIIMGRLDDILQLKVMHDSSISLVQTNNERRQGDINESIHRCRMRQSKRLKQQLAIINRHASYITTQMVFNDCLHIMAKYDPDFAFIFPEQIRSQETEVSLKKIMNIFMQKHSTSKASHLAKFITESGQQINPCEYLTWLSDWSRATFFQCIRVFIKSNVNAYSGITDGLAVEQKSEKIKKFTRKMKTQPIQQFKIYFFSREHLYSFIIDELNEYYQSRSFMNLDHDYLQKIKKNKGKNLGNNINMMSNYLSEANFNEKTRSDIEKYAQQYSQKYKNNNQKIDIASSSKSINIKKEKPAKKICTEPSVQQQQLSIIKMGLLKQLKTHMLNQTINFTSNKQTHQAPLFNFIKRNKNSSINQSFKQKSFSLKMQQSIQDEKRYQFQLSKWRTTTEARSPNKMKKISRILRTETKEQITSFNCKTQQIIMQCKQYNSIYRHNWTKNKRLERNFTNIG